MKTIYIKFWVSTVLQFFFHADWCVCVDFMTKVSVPTDRDYRIEANLILQRYVKKVDKSCNRPDFVVRN